MSSHYTSEGGTEIDDVEIDPEAEDWREPMVEKSCSACKGQGYTIVHDQETDCIPCEGYGTILIFI